ncbi:hypothetical protein AYO20_03420 [Fonsecaea nubica]|uniref:Cwf19-like C-terminal domain-containing protein n=1 Tax=Fonsecaea nubica TaxID=856822 RepID=A0A178D799_9EURO|nr:hypothetical protein AYO20_03420 [Fonsecaea nubica]OAL37244.1 hypothetical protein AYO20_03420 [Fonsecaea nubica]
MTLEEFERELAEQKETEKRRERRKEHEKSGHRHRHHHHRSSRHGDSHYDEEDGHRSKRTRHSREDDDESESRHRHRHHHHRRRRESKEENDTEEAAEEEGEKQPPTASSGSGELKRDAWMEAPSALEIDYIQKKRREPSPKPTGGSLEADFGLKIHTRELNHHLRDLKNGTPVNEAEEESPTHEVDYTFGDAGSQWRMTRLNGVYRQAEETGRKVDDVALEQYDSLREFDDAREEKIELDRRKIYGKGYVSKDKPSGELFQERKTDAVTGRSQPQETETSPDVLLEQIPVPTPTSTTQKVDQTALNKLKAQLMRAKIRKDPKAADLEREYNDALAASESQDPTIITLSAMDNRMLSSAPRNEVKAVQNRRGAERGQVEENEDMSIEDMVREERRSRGQQGGEGSRLAERIAKDAKFDNDLDYLEENAEKLAKRMYKSETNLRNVAINEYQKLNKILENCPLCHHEDTETPPIAPVVSLATRTYLTLPTEPELSPQATMIVPTEHRTNLLECDDDEWEEIRNFMKSLTRMYHDQGRDVIFYENAAFPHRKPHAALCVIPLPYSLGETAPAFFKEAFLSTEDEWSQHKKIIDTLAKAKTGGLGRLAFRRSLVKEMPYFHVWFELDGGIGHIVEDQDRWPRGDLFAREIIGGMLGLEPDVIKRQGRWHRGTDKRVEGFRKAWRKFDWTRVLTEGGG